MPRSALRVAWATCQPAFSGPTRFCSGSPRRRGTSRRSANRRGSCGSVARRSPASACRREYEIPRRLGASTSVRASRRHQSAWRAPLAHSFWPLTTNRSPTRPGRRPQAGEIGARLGLGEALAPDLSVEDRREVAPALLLGAGLEQRRRRVVDRHEREDEPGHVVRRQLLVEHDLLGRGHAAAPLGRPVRHGVAGTAQLLEPVLLEGDEVVLRHAGLRLAPPGGHVRLAPRPDLGP